MRADGTFWRFLDGFIECRWPRGIAKAPAQREGTYMLITLSRPAKGFRRTGTICSISPIILHQFPPTALVQLALLAVCSTEIIRNLWNQPRRRCRQGRSSAAGSAQPWPIPGSTEPRPAAGRRPGSDSARPGLDASHSDGDAIPESDSDARRG